MSPLPPLVTVITPVYNGEPYLAQAIESVLAQTYPRIEYLIVDNASTDGSRATAARYAAVDSRVRVIAAEEFVDQIANFNRAVRLMAPEAKYCKFVLADDWIYPDCVAEMIRAAETDPAVVVVGALRYSGDVVRCTGLPGPRWPDLISTVDGRVAGRYYLLENQHLFGSPSSVLYRSDLVRSRPEFFPKAGPNQDTELCFQALASAKFGFVHRLLTYSRTENESISSENRRYDPAFRVSRLVMIRRHGPVYLTAGEQAAIVARLERDLYRYLAGNVLRSDQRGSWKYYQRALGQAGISLRYGRMAAALARRALELVGNPVQTIGKLAPTKEERLEADS